jgi:hypothetical protein
MIRQITVCKGCKDRFLGCHGVCERYLKQCEEQDAIKAKMVKDHNMDAAFTDLVLRTNERRRRNG